MVKIEEKYNLREQKRFWNIYIFSQNFKFSLKLSTSAQQLVVLEWPE